MKQLKEALITKKNINHIRNEKVYIILPFGSDSNILFSSFEPIESPMWDIFILSSKKINHAYNKEPNDIFSKFDHPLTKVWKTSLPIEEIKKYFHDNLEYKEYKPIVSILEKNRHFESIR